MKRNIQYTLCLLIVIGTVGLIQAEEMDDAAMKAFLLQQDPGRAQGTPGLPPATIDTTFRQQTIGCNQSVDFDSGLPGDWSIVNNEPNGPTWGDLASCGESDNFTNGAADVACVSSDVFGSADYDTELRTPAFSTVGQVTVSVNFTANYQNYANYDFLDVDVSIDGGAMWINALRWNEDHGTMRATPGEDVSIDISSVAANQASVIIRWRYYDPTTSPDYDWYAQVDNVSVTCVVPVELQSLTIE